MLIDLKHVISFSLFKVLKIALKMIFKNNLAITP